MFARGAMNIVCRRLWDRGMTIRKWSLINGFNPRYAQVVMSGGRGSWNVGTAKKIKTALIDQGFANEKDFSNEVIK